MSERPANQTAFEALYAAASQQAGYFTAAQARACGYSYRQLTYYAKTGRLERIGVGIYRLGQFPASPHEDLFVAWLAVGPSAVISHESALALYELSDALPVETHLIIPRNVSRRHRGVRLHTSRLTADEITRVAGLPATTVSRTIADVARHGLAEELVVQAVRQAVQRGMTTRESLSATAERHGGRARRLIHRALQESEA